MAEGYPLTQPMTRYSTTSWPRAEGECPHEALHTFTAGELMSVCYSPINWRSGRAECCYAEPDSVATLSC